MGPGAGQVLYGEEKMHFPLPRIEPRFVGCGACTPTLGMRCGVVRYGRRIGGSVCKDVKESGRSFFQDTISKYAVERRENERNRQLGWPLFHP